MDAPSLSLLFAVSAPVSVLVALHVWLVLEGESGTLLLPSGGTYEPTSSPTLVLMAMTNAAALARIEEKMRRLAAANDERFHEAA